MSREVSRCSASRLRWSRDGLLLQPCVCQTKGSTEESRWPLGVARDDKNWNNSLTFSASTRDTVCPRDNSAACVTCDSCVTHSPAAVYVTYQLARVVDHSQHVSPCSQLWLPRSQAASGEEKSQTVTAWVRVETDVTDCILSSRASKWQTKRWTSWQPTFISPNCPAYVFCSLL